MKRLLFSALLFVSCAAPAMQPNDTLLCRAIMYTYNNPKTVLEVAGTGAVVIAGITFAPVPALIALGHMALDPQVAKTVDEALKMKGN